MSEPIQQDEALYEAERTCFDKLVQVMGLQGEGIDAFISTNGGKVECAVFDIGYPQTGETTGFPATTHHWRAQLEMYSRNRRQLQKWIMRLMLAFPNAPTQGVASELYQNTTVKVLRIAPETRAVSEITTTELKSDPAKAGVNAFTCSVAFDVVFTIGRRTAETAAH